MKTLIIFSLIFLSMCIGCQNRGEGLTPDAECKPFERPCNEVPRVSHAYSECCKDGFWHVVQDDYHFCPALQKFRVPPDTPTMQRCKEGAGPIVSAPNPVGTGYKDFQGDTACQSAVVTNPKRVITISVCENGFFVNKTYTLYQCLDKSIRIHEPPDSVTRTDVKCTDPPPPPPVSQPATPPPSPTP